MAAFQTRSPDPAPQAQGRPRLLGIDLARSLALAAMVVFHFCYDLQLAGFLPQGTVQEGAFWYLARITAGSFLFLAGMGLVLSHEKTIRWQAFARRQLRIALAAALVTLASAVAMPGMTIFFGILHSIFTASLLGLALLRLPAGGLIAISAAVFALPYFWSHPALGGIWIWLGLSGSQPMTADFEPLFPWFAPFVAGMALAKIIGALGLWRALAWQPCNPARARLWRALAWPGRHSLAIYLIHQPLLLGLVMAARALI